jgi:hypothetical protein
MPPFVIESCDNMEIRLAAGLMSGTAVRMACTYHSQLIHSCVFLYRIS